MVILAVGLAGLPAAALNKQGARSSAADAPKKNGVNLSGTVFAGVLFFNPTYAARPNNTGLALLRYGLHLDLDLYGRYLTLSYDENTFTDHSPDSDGWYLPSEHDHIVGLLSTIPLRRNFSLTLAVHYELDAVGYHPNARYRAAHPDCTVGGMLQPPACYDAGYTQSYVDAYARLSWAKGPFSWFLALGGFLYNPTYAARPDNAGLALLRYVFHGEIELLPWLVLRLDLNFFTDRDQSPLIPTELDATSEVALKWRDFELRIIGEADLPIGDYPASGPHPAPTPGLKQFYMAALLQWSFDARALAGR
jgi:hypothetical protein